MREFQDAPNNDPSTSSLESIVDTMLESMTAGPAEAFSVSRAEIKSLIFANSEMDILSNTMQSLEEGEVNQNWLCSATEVPGLSKRKVAIARMSENTNMGEGANEVKFFILILCPSNIKGKSSHVMYFQLYIIGLLLFYIYIRLYYSIFTLHVLLRNNDTILCNL